MTLGIALSLVFSSCSQKRAPTPKRNFQVSVKQDGQAVTSFSESLVHRFALSLEDASLIFGPAPEHMNFPYALKPKADLRGGIVGFEVIETFETRARLESGMSSLGLQIGDLVTAVGKMRITHEQDLWHIYDLLKLKKQASLTIERDGMPHKFLYFLKDS
jgi:hypothetical protein